MNEFLTVLGAVVPVLAIVGAGFLLRKVNWLTEAADQSLLRLTINLLLPCLIFDAALGNAALRHLANLTLAPLVGFATFTLGLLAARAAVRVAGLQDRRAQRTFALTVGLHNYGFIPVPLTLLLFDEQTLGVLFVHNVGVEIAVWTLGLMMLTGRSPGAGWKQLLNAPLVAIVVVLLFNFTGLHAHVPAVIRTLAHLLAQCAIPLSLLLIGATVADQLVGFHSAAGWRVILVAALLRLGVLPVLFLLLAKSLPATVELQRVIVLEAAMPSAVFPIVMVKHYGGDTPTALRVILGTSLLGLVTIPLWIRLGMKFVGV